MRERTWIADELLDCNEFDPAVLRPAFFGVVTGDRGRHAGAFGLEAGGAIGIFGHQFFDDGVGARLAELQVGIGTADAIGMTHDSQLAFRIFLQVFADFIERRSRLRLDVGFVEVKQDAIKIDAAFSSIAFCISLALTRTIWSFILPA